MRLNWTALRHWVAHNLLMRMKSGSVCVISLWLAIYSTIQWWQGWEEMIKRRGSFEKSVSSIMNRSSLCFDERNHIEKGQGIWEITFSYSTCGCKFRLQRQPNIVTSDVLIINILIILWKNHLQRIHQYFSVYMRPAGEACIVDNGEIG